MVLGCVKTSTHTRSGPAPWTARAGFSSPVELSADPLIRQSVSRLRANLALVLRFARLRLARLRLRSFLWARLWLQCGVSPHVLRILLRPRSLRLVLGGGHRGQPQGRRPRFFWLGFVKLGFVKSRFRLTRVRQALDSPVHPVQHPVHRCLNRLLPVRVPALQPFPLQTLPARIPLAQSLPTRLVPALLARVLLIPARSLQVRLPAAQRPIAALPIHRLSRNRPQHPAQRRSRIQTRSSFRLVDFRFKRFPLRVVCDKRLRLEFICAGRRRFQFV